MPTIPTHPDPTQAALNAAIQAANVAEKPRPYLGMSSIGEDCERRLWYGFRWCLPAGGGFDAKALRNFADGHRVEDAYAAWLRQVPGVELYTVDPVTGQQFGFSDHGGHFRGHIDGAIRGLLQAPKTWHVWEHKASEKGTAELQKAKAEHGEKSALAAWHPTYYAQAQVYMHYAGMTRHYITVTSPGGRLPESSARTDADPATAARLIDKAKRVITAQNPPQRLSEDSTFYKCKWCPAAAMCHASALPDPNCRNCVHATPELDGDGRWSCARWKQDIPQHAQHEGCPQHRFIPALLARWGEAVDASEAENWIEYKGKAGTFRNGEWGPGSFTSAELAASTPELMRDEVFQAARLATGGVVVKEAA